MHNPVWKAEINHDTDIITLTFTDGDTTVAVTHWLERLRGLYSLLTQDEVFMAYLKSKGRTCKLCGKAGKNPCRRCNRKLKRMCKRVKRTGPSIPFHPLERLAVPTYGCSNPVTPHVFESDEQPEWETGAYRYIPCHFCGHYARSLKEGEQIAKDKQLEASGD